MSKQFSCSGGHACRSVCCVSYLLMNSRSEKTVMDRDKSCTAESLTRGSEFGASSLQQLRTGWPRFHRQQILSKSFDLQPWDAGAAWICHCNPQDWRPLLYFAQLGQLARQASRTPERLPLTLQAQGTVPKTPRAFLDPNVLSLIPPNFDPGTKREP